MTTIVNEVSLQEEIEVAAAPSKDELLVSTIRELDLNQLLLIGGGAGVVTFH